MSMIIGKLEPSREIVPKIIYAGTTKWSRRKDGKWIDENGKVLKSEPLKEAFLD